MCLFMGNTHYPWVHILHGYTGYTYMYYMWSTGGTIYGSVEVRRVRQQDQARLRLERAAPSSCTTATAARPPRSFWSNSFQESSRSQSSRRCGGILLQNKLDPRPYQPDQLLCWIWLICFGKISLQLAFISSQYCWRSAILESFPMYQMTGGVRTMRKGIRWNISTPKKPRKCRFWISHIWTARLFLSLIWDPNLTREEAMNMRTRKESVRTKISQNVEVQVGILSRNLETWAAASLIEKRGFSSRRQAGYLGPPCAITQVSISVDCAWQKLLALSSRFRYCFEIASWLWHEHENSLSGFEFEQQQHALSTTCFSAAPHSPSQSHQLLLCFNTICTETHNTHVGETSSKIVRTLLWYRTWQHCHWPASSPLSLWDRVQNWRSCQKRRREGGEDKEEEKEEEDGDGQVVQGDAWPRRRGQALRPDWQCGRGAG